MMAPVREALRALRHPRQAFEALAQAPPRPGRDAGRMLLWWLPPALLHGLLTARSALAAYGAIRAGHLPDWAARLLLPGLDPEGVAAFLRDLPAPPPTGRVLLLAGACVPLLVLSTWLHHAVWDHTALWILRGSRGKGGFRTTLRAESWALRIAALGVWAGLLGFLPWLGPVLALPLALLAGYLWIFRGFALAAAHGTPTWKGLAATVLHVVLLGCFTLLLAGAVLAMAAATG